MLNLKIINLVNIVNDYLFIILMFAIKLDQTFANFK